MRRVVLSVALLLGCADNPVTPVVKQTRHEARIGSPSVIVQLSSGSAEEVARAHGVTPTHVYRHAIQGFSASVSDIARAGLMKDARVKRISDEVTMSTSETWGLDRIDQRNLPLDNSYSPDRTGSGVHAYIIDSGIRTGHPEFSGRISTGADFTGSGSVEDCIGHGTHVSGTVGGSTFGVAKQVTLHPVRVFGCSGSSPSSVIIAGLDWVAANRQLPCVVNMSLGGVGDPATDAAVEGVIATGCTVAVAAGNSSSDACDFSPARVPGALTSGASDDLDARASFSNVGICLDLYAPGVGIMSAWHSADSASLSGTSMASPHTAGVVALFLEGRPNASPSEVSDSVKAYSTKAKVNARHPLLYSGREIDSTPTPPPPPAPSAPYNLTATPWAEQRADYWQMIMFQWGYGTDEVTDFLIFGTSDTGYQLSGTTPGNGRNVAALLPPGRWSVKVRAVNDGGTSDWSNVATVCIPSPDYSCGPTTPPPPPPDTITPPPPPPDTTTPPPCRPRGKSGKCK